MPIRDNCKSPIWGQIRAFAKFQSLPQIAYTQSYMSICGKFELCQNHRIWPPKRLLQLSRMD